MLVVATIAMTIRGQSREVRTRTLSVTMAKPSSTLLNIVQEKILLMTKKLSRYRLMSSLVNIRLLRLFNKSVMEKNAENT